MSAAGSYGIFVTAGASGLATEGRDQVGIQPHERDRLGDDRLRRESSRGAHFPWHSYQNESTKLSALPGSSLGKARALFAAALRQEVDRRARLDHSAAEAGGCRVDIRPGPRLTCPRPATPPACSKTLEMYLLGVASRPPHGGNELRGHRRSDVPGGLPDRHRMLAHRHSPTFITLQNGRRLFAS